jgi:hypothetical protein
VALRTAIQDSVDWVVGVRVHRGTVEQREDAVVAAASLNGSTELIT